MGLIKHFKDEGDDFPLSFRNTLLDAMKKDSARLKQLIARYRTVKPAKASKLLVSIHKIIDKHM
jgi:hypothetical protein